jgi:hypothetical protein
VTADLKVAKIVRPAKAKINKKEMDKMTQIMNGFGKYLKYS